MTADLKLVSGDDATRAKALDAALAQIDRAFGKGSAMRLGDREKVDVEAISTGSLGLDMALGIGGMPRGRIVEIYGPESSGKPPSPSMPLPKPRRPAAPLRSSTPSTLSILFMLASLASTSTI